MSSAQDLFAFIFPTRCCLHCAGEFYACSARPSLPSLLALGHFVLLTETSQRSGAGAFLAIISFPLVPSLWKTHWNFSNKFSSSFTIRCLGRESHLGFLQHGFYQARVAVCLHQLLPVRISVRPLTKSKQLPAFFPNLFTVL